MSQRTNVFVFISIIVGFFVAFTAVLASSFTMPAFSPPNCPSGDACNPPINIGSQKQKKYGDLIVGGKLTADGDLIVGGKLTADGKLTANGKFVGRSSVRSDGVLWANSDARIMGKLGIGVVSPSSKLDVNGGIAANSLKLSSLAGSGIKCVRADSGGTLILASSDCGSGGGGGSPDGDWIVSGSRMYSGVSGNVGIGTSNPLAKLDVRGNARIDQITLMNTLKLVKFAGNGTKCLHIDNSGIVGIAGSDCGSGGGGASLWSASGSNVYRNSGSVGIGTASPGAKLDVRGNVNVTGTITKVGDWGVFLAGSNKASLPVRVGEIYNRAGIWNGNGSASLGIGSVNGNVDVIGDNNTWGKLNTGDISANGNGSVNGSLTVGGDAVIKGRNTTVRGHLNADGGISAGNSRGTVNSFFTGTVNIDYGGLDLGTTGYIMANSMRMPFFGGMYSTTGTGDSPPKQCKETNPVTGNCSCPSGFSTNVVARINGSGVNTRRIVMCILMR